MKDNYAKDILTKVCDLYHISTTDILENKNRHKQVILAKITAAHYLMERYSMKFVQHLLNYKSHASIIHAINTYNTMMETDTDFIYKSFAVMDNKVYICGKTKGVSDREAKKLYSIHEAFLGDFNHNPINIMQLAPNIRNAPSFINLRLKLLKLCDYIYIMDNARECEYGRIEIDIANKLGIKEWRI